MHRRLGYENLEQRFLLAAEFHMLALIYPEAELGGIRKSMPPELVEAHTKAVQMDLPQAIAQIAGDQVEARVHVEVVDRVLNDLQMLDGRYQYAVESSIATELDEFTRSGWYDHVMVIHGFDDPTIGPTALWGGGATLRYGMSLASLNYGNIGTDQAYFDFSAAAIHEWIHGLESQYFYYRGVPTGMDPEGGILDLHDAEEFGYNHDDEGRARWLIWYSDFLTGRIRNLHSDGSDTGLGLGPDVWALGPPRQDVPLEPGSPLSFPEVSANGVTFLSDVYFGSTSTNQDVIERIPRGATERISIGGYEFDSGVKVTAGSEIAVNLFGRAARFDANVGIPDNIGETEGSVLFEIVGDDKLLWASEGTGPQDVAIPVSVDVTGVNQLKLRVTDAGTPGVDDVAA